MKAFFIKPKWRFKRKPILTKIGSLLIETERAVHERTKYATTNRAENGSLAIETEYAFSK
jgi:hypothetical protein